MTTLTKNFTATGDSVVFQVAEGDYLQFVVAGTFVGTVKLQQSIDLVTPTWEDVYTKTAAFDETFQANRPGDEGGMWFRMSCTAFTSGTIETSLAQVAAPDNGYVTQDELDAALAAIPLIDATVAANVPAPTVSDLTTAVGDIALVISSLVAAGIMDAP
jgi:hypothetical protein